MPSFVRYAQHSGGEAEYHGLIPLGPYGSHECRFALNPIIRLANSVHPLRAGFACFALNRRLSKFGAKNYVAQQGGEDATKGGLSLEHAVDVLLAAGLLTP